MDYFLFDFSGVQFNYTMSHFNNNYEEKYVKDFCHSGHFFDIHVNSACCKAKQPLTVYIMSGQHKICPKCPFQANTGKAKRRMQKACHPHGLQANLLLRFLLITYVSTSTASTACKRFRI